MFSTLDNWFCRELNLGTGRIYYVQGVSLERAGFWRDGDGIKSFIPSAVATRLIDYTSPESDQKQISRSGVGWPDHAAQSGRPVIIYALLNKFPEKIEIR